MTKKITNPINTEKMKETKNKEFESKFSELVRNFHKEVSKLFDEYGKIEEAGFFSAAYTEDMLLCAIMGFDSTAIENLSILCEKNKNARKIISKTAFGILEQTN